MDIINIYDNYNSYFNAELKAIFEQCSKIASKRSYKLYLIGGMVRDLLLNEKSLDIDITVEGDAIGFAKILEKELNAKIISTHKSFGTVKVEIQNHKIDFASTRSETYPKAGHLPHVEKIGCSLKEDVLRRDFTINSLAMSLNQDDFANLIDYTDGFKDLRAKKIRVLHPQSFIDDPTRIIRALKYSTRLGFKIEDKTLKRQEDYLNNINYDMCYKRVKQEIKKTFEQNSQKAFEQFMNQGIYKLITTKKINFPNINIEKLIAKYHPKYPWIVYFGIIAIQENIKISELTKYEKETIEGAKFLIKQSFKDDFELYKAFSIQKLETLLILAALRKEKEVLHYLDKLSRIKLYITGNDLIKLGLKPSSEFNKLFDIVLKAKLKKPEMTKSEEIEIIKAQIKQIC